MSGKKIYIRENTRTNGKYKSKWIPLDEKQIVKAAIDILKKNNWSILGLNESRRIEDNGRGGP